MEGRLGSTPFTEDDEAERTRSDAKRIMLYSHDTFGLGHLRRSRAIATALTAADPSASAIILTGSPVAGRFTFPARVDHVRLPGVKKLRDGSYVSQTLGMDIDETTALRSGLIRSAIKQFDPDLLIVDKEPAGFRGELLPTLEWLENRGSTRCVLGLRDVLDEEDVLSAEWERKGAIAATERFYDEIWVYGPDSFYDPTRGLDLNEDTRARMHWTGFLRREVTDLAATPEDPYVLITPGGGGDGRAMVDLVLQAYEKDPTLSPQAVLVYGPFLSGDVRDAFEERVAALNDRVQAVGFDARIEIPVRWCARRGLHGWLQYFLRGFVLRSAGRDRAAYCPSTGAMDQGRTGRGTGSCAHAGRDPRRHGC